MRIITTHLSADFDAFAAAVCAVRLYPGYRVLFPGSQELAVRRFLADFDDKTVAVVCVDPTRRRTGGALLGDRIRMNAIHHPNVYMRSLATRQSNLALSKHVREAVSVLQAAGFDLIIAETAGIGQGDSQIVDLADVAMYVMTAEFGAAFQKDIAHVGQINFIQSSKPGPPDVRAIGFNSKNPNTGSRGPKLDQD